MNESLYIELQGDAKELLDEFGYTVQLTQTTPGTGALVVHDVLLAKVDRVTRIHDAYDIEIGDWFCVAEEKGFEYAVGDVVQLPDVATSQRVVRAQPIKPGSICVVWYVWLRNG